uniref:DDE-1 domain-containing protein n=1 Tax=Phytophthora ramorum TaxID=164328 RepID=H3GVE9_PHYRM
MFASGVGAKVKDTYKKACIFNADKTAVYYDDTPTRIISERGANNGAKIKGQTRSGRASVLLIVSATGRKLRPIIIFKGQPGGRVEEEVKGISNKVVTAVQKNA